MKIEKKAIKNVSKSVNSSVDYIEEGRKHIEAAIKCLGQAALEDKSNVIAKESIANLGVVLFDLK